MNIWWELDEDNVPRPTAEVKRERRNIIGRSEILQFDWKSRQVRKEFISTVFLGMDMSHGFGDGPLFFETMSFKADVDGEVTDWSENYFFRYSTYEKAVSGHRVALHLFRSKLAVDVMLASFFTIPFFIFIILLARA